MKRKEERGKKKEGGNKRREAGCKSQVSSFKSLLSKVFTPKITIALFITIFTLLIYFAQLTGFSIYGEAGYGLSDVDLSNISTCQDLTTSGIYTLNTSITVSGTCFSVNVSNVVLNGNGYSITGSATGFGVRNIGGFDNITVKNFGNISNFSVGLNFQGGTANATLQNNTITGATINTDGQGILMNASSGGIQATSSIITSNAITTSGALGTGIWTRTSDITISSNTLTITGSNSSGIYAQACTTCLITGNTITMTDNTTFNAYGIYYLGTQFNTATNITSNVINVSNGTADAVYVDTLGGRLFYNTIQSSAGRAINALGVNGGNISFNTILSDGTLSTESSPWGIAKLASARAFEWNNITRTGNSALNYALIDAAGIGPILSNILNSTDAGWTGVLYGGESSRLQILSNTIQTTSGPGVNITSGGLANITSNTLISQNGPALFIMGNTSTMTSNTITTTGTNATGIYIKAKQIIIDANTITTNGDDSDGIIIEGVHANNKGTQNSITTKGNSSSAILFTGGPTNTNFTDDTINTTAISYGIENANGNNNTFTNIRIITPTASDIYINQGNVILLNSSFTKNNATFEPSATGNYTAQWFVNVNITNGSQQLSNRIVTAYTTNSILQTTETTDSNGLGRLIITEYFQNTSGINYYTPHTINSSGEDIGNLPNSTTLNISTTNSTSIQLSLAEDISSPNVTINTPTTRAYNTNFTINTTVADNLRTANVSYPYKNRTKNKTHK